jgi:hypothetical protein
MNRYAKLALLCLSFASVPLIMAPRNGAGTYSLPAGNPVVSGTTISSTVHNNTMSDIATALTASIAKDGQTTATANLPMGTFRHTNVGNPTLRNQYGTVDNIQDGDYTVLSSVAGTNTITAALSPTPTAYVAGMQVVLIPANTNTGATTLNISSIGALDVQKYTTSGQVNVAADDLRAGIPALLILDTGGDDWIVLNPYSSSLPSGTIWASSNDGSGSGLDADLIDGTAIVGSQIWTSANDGAASGLDADTIDGTAITGSEVRTIPNSGRIAYGRVAGATGNLSKSLNVTSTARTGTGTYTANLTAAGFTVTPVCIGIVNTVANSGVTVTGDATSTTAAAFTVYTGSVSARDEDFQFVCHGI